MNLYLSRSWHMDCVLSDDDGKALYQIKTPGLLRTVSTIYKVAPDAALRYKEELAKGKDVGKDWDFPVEECARIQWHVFKTSRLIHNGVIHEIEKFMPATGGLHPKRTFTGPDGLTYTWHMENSSCHLDLEDGTNPSQTVARTHPPTLKRGKKPFLEIHTQGLHMVELIVITWVFVEAQWFYGGR